MLRLSTVDLHILISSDQLRLFQKIYYFTKQAILTWRPTVLSLSLQEDFLGTPSINGTWLAALAK
jgi:hypothetical protein